MATRGFPLVNVTHLDQAMDQRGLDALVCRSGVNVTYLSGMEFPGTLGRHVDFADTPRDTFLVWPRRGEPILVLYHMSAPLAERASWVKDLHLYAEYAGSPSASVTAALERLGLRQSSLGFDLAAVGARRWAELTASLPKARLSDCTEMLDEVRAVKTPAEIDRLRNSALLMDRAYSRVFPAIRPGVTEREVHSRMVAELLRIGAQSAHGILRASSNHTLYGGESDFCLTSGDSLYGDYAAYVDNYAANLTRMLAIGPPSKETRDNYRTLLRVHRRAVEMLRPGVTAGEVFTGVRELFHEVGWQHTLPMAGHGIGTWFHQQPPIIREGNPQRLRTGMVICLEPVSHPWHIQDEFLITDDGCQRLSAGFDISELMFVE